MGHAKTAASVSPQEKLSRMAQQLAAHQVDVYYIPPEDEHLNEYLPPYRQRIEWLTGFTGESAPLLVTPARMRLYVDGRFHLQVDDEVDPSVVSATKLEANESASAAIAKTIQQLAAEKGETPLRVGYDPFLVSPEQMNALKKKELPGTLSIDWAPVPKNLADVTWTERPAPAATKAFAINETLAGESVSSKLTRIRAEMQKQGVDLLPLTKLDDIGWLFNIRGGDIPFNPVLESYALITPDKALLFAPPSKIDTPLTQQLQAAGVSVQPYERYAETLHRLLAETTPQARVLVDKSSLTLGTLEILNNRSVVVEGSNPVTQLKAIKNPTEIAGMKAAGFRASRAIIRHMAWFTQAVAAGHKLSEADVRADIEAKYKEEPGFFDLSFPTIPGIGANSAIIHYSKADPQQIGQPGDFYLLDSGCQYADRVDDATTNEATKSTVACGTTDNTRVTVFGQPKPDKIAKHTAVLRAHINCASFRFPEGTSGAQIDAACREPMWRDWLDFAHGTGHGVGAFLNVHEGPNRISRAAQVAFKPGMITSIEPGYYEEGWGGIRLENLYTVITDPDKPASAKGKWFRFEPLTFVPFEKKLIDTTKLLPHERAWLETYYQRVWDTMSPTLSAEEQAWLKDQVTLPA